jgi:putative membrane protein
MTRSTTWLLAAGGILFIAVLVSQDLTSVLATLAVARWGLLLVALFHLLPLLLDAAAISVLFEAPSTGVSWRGAVLARWAGESANSLLPAGQLAGPVVMLHQLSRRGLPMQDAVAAITVSTTLQALAQVVFALIGVALLGYEGSLDMQTSQGSQHAVGPLLLMVCSLLALLSVLLYLMQRRALFGRSIRTIARFCGKRDWSRLMSRAEAIDLAIRNTYHGGTRAPASFTLSLIGWLVGTGEVFLILQLLGCPVGWADALLLESLGQAIRGAAFAVPGALGVQEGGYLMLAPLAGLQPDAAVALSLGKRARELLLGVPGLLYLYLSARVWRRRQLVRAATD